MSRGASLGDFKLDGKRNPPILKPGKPPQDGMDPELRNVLGKAAGRVVLPSSSKLNPQVAPKPRRPNQGPGPELQTEVPPTPEGCIAPIFPIVPESDVHLYLEEKRG